VILYLLDMLAVCAHSKNYLMGVTMRAAGNKGFKALNTVDAAFRVETFKGAINNRRRWTTLGR
jgi:hypothetical protein